MANRHCCVPQCVGDSRYDSSLSFHSFPSDIPSEAARRKQWLINIKRDVGSHFKITAATKVCSNHFLPSDFKLGKSRRILIANAVPTVFNFASSVPEIYTTRAAPRRSPRKRNQVALEESLFVDTTPDLQNASEQEQETIAVSSRHTADASADNLLLDAQQEIEDLKRKLSVEKFGLHRFGDNDEKVNLFTGFNSSKLLYDFIAFIKPTASIMKSYAQHQRKASFTLTTIRGKLLSVEDELLMFLMRVRLGSFTFDLAERFNVSNATVSRTVIAMTNYLYFTLGGLSIYPSKQAIKRSMPLSFASMYPEVVVILDCTEIRCETPSSMVIQSETYSNYKSHTTLKGLFGITPCGAVSFISHLYTGSISDKEITIQSGILGLLERGDEVMADKGFLINDALKERGCSLVIPPFLAEQDQFTRADTELTQSIARLRIHVERAIRRVKEYHIFDSVIGMSLTGSINQIWTVCCILTNFKGNLY